QRAGAEHEAAPAWCGERRTGWTTAEASPQPRCTQIRHCSRPGFVCWCLPPSAVENGHRPRPPGRGTLDLHREARHHEAGRRQLFEIVQLFDVAIADVAAGL